MGFAITALSLLVCAAVFYAIVAVFLRSEPSHSEETPTSGEDSDKPS